ncbi:MAG: hypothetical protein JW793_15760 [Acidobacteria bacterium]|nr:hypothetical protein [Acidobacteriota bacterium]
MRTPGKTAGRCLPAAVVLFAALWVSAAAFDSGLPQFGRDTVLVWEITGANSTSDFVARIAAFSPDLLMEWEDSKSQGTVYIPGREIMEAGGYVHTRLFQSGIDVRAEGETTAWLSRRIYRELKDKKEAKLKIDRVPGRMTCLGEEELMVEINGSAVKLPVIKVRDNRKAEMWFLDVEHNPLMVQYRTRHYRKILVSITTNRADTLRWLKGKKLQRLLSE